MFVDGTAIDPSLPTARLAAWAVILAGSVPGEVGHALASGPVTGQWQTVMRAETTAFASACNYGVLLNQDFFVWSDCEVVANRAHQIQAGLLTVTNKMADHDLWETISGLIAGNPRCHVRQVHSHQDRCGIPDWMDWAFAMNEAADQQAKLAITAIPARVRELQQQLKQEIRQAEVMKKHLHEHFARVGEIAQQHTAVVAPVKQPVNKPDVPAVNLARVAELASNAEAKLRFPGFAVILTWMQRVHDPRAPIHFVSWFEMLAMFQLQTGEYGVVSSGTHKQWGLQSKHVQYDARKMAHHWATYLTYLFRLHREGFKPGYMRPRNFRYQCWAMGAYLQVSEAAQSELNTWFGEVMGSRSITSVRQLSALPVANLAPTVEKKPITFGLHRYFT